MLSKNKKKKSSKGDIIFSVFLALIFIGIIGFAVVSNVRVSVKREQYNKQIEDLKKQIQEMEEKKKELERGVSQADNLEYMEEIARKNFGLKKEGEEVVVISKEEEEEKKTEEKKKDDKNIWDPKTWWEWISGEK